MMNLSGKRLLILGANPETVALVNAARDLDVYTVVTDNNRHAYAKKFADKSYDIDGMDVPSLVALARAEGVDGVLVGVADRLIEPYRQVCGTLGLPCYGTSEQCAIFTDKQRFNQRCTEYGISPIPSFELDRNFYDEDLNRLRFPLFIKPVDGNSGKGMTVCHGRTEVRNAVDRALAASRSGRFLVERCMDCDDIFMSFTFKDGEFWLSAIADRYTTREQGNGSRVCLGAIYPSKHVDLYFDTLHDKFCRMFKDMDVQNGVLMVSGFVENGCIHVYDPGFRLQGEAPDLHIHAISGFDQKAMLIRYALSGSMGPEELDKLNDCRFRGQHSATIWYLAKEGKIGQIDGIPEMVADRSVVKIVQRLFEGDSVTKEMVGTEAQVVARVYISCETRAQLAEKVKQHRGAMVVRDEQGSPMLLDSFDVGVI